LLSSSIHTVLVWPPGNTKATRSINTANNTRPPLSHTSYSSTTYIHRLVQDSPKNKKERINHDL